MVALKRRLCWIDTKEKNHHPYWFEDGPLAGPGSFAYERLVARTRSQEIGDVWIELEHMQWLIVELKTWGDFHASVRDSADGRHDSRLRHQLRGLLDMQSKGFKVAVMLVGTITPAGGKPAAGRRPTGVYVTTESGRRSQRSKWSWFEVEQTRATVQHLGILTYQCPTSSEIPHALRLLAELVEREEVLEAPGLARVATLAPRHSFLVTALTAVDDVGIATATAIANRYKTFACFFREGTEEDLRQVPGIGKVLAARIYRAFHDYESDSDIPVSDQGWSL